MKIVKETKGITLIALVITVVVLLILAGITIGTLTGDNGIIRKAIEAKEQVEISEEQKIIEQSVVQASAINKYGNIEKDQLEKQIRKTIDNVSVSDTGEEIEVFLTEKNRYYIVDKKGNVSDAQTIIKDSYPGDITKDKDGKTLDGTSEDTAFEIWCIEDLIEWSKNYNKYSSSYIKLGRNLNFKSIASYANSQSIDYGDINEDGNVQTIIEEMQSGIGFTPIAVFSGTFNGNNYEIQKIYINNNKKDNFGGFFNTLGNGAYIYDFIISGNIINTGVGNNTSAGGIAGRIDERSVNVKIDKCCNKCDISGVGYIGGIIGRFGGNTNSIKNCCNYGNLTLNSNASTYTGVGGIVGRTNSDDEEISNCYNLGKIVNNCSVVYSGAGGIIGNTITYKVKVNNCYNVGTVKGTYSNGAIIGGFWYSDWKSTVEKCSYLEGSCTRGIGAGSGNDKLAAQTAENSILKHSEKYMKSQEFVNELNEYVTKYNEEHKNEEDFIKLREWKLDEKTQYPTL